jgi:hypothetical protein
VLCERAEREGQGVWGRQALEAAVRRIAATRCRLSLSVPDLLLILLCLLSAVASTSSADPRNKPERALDCWAEVDAFKAQVSKLEQAFVKSLH